MFACSSSSSSSSLAIMLPSASSSLSSGFDGFSTAETSTVSTFNRSPVTPSPSKLVPKVASKSITSLNKISSFNNSSVQIVIAWKVKGLSHNPNIIVLLPASILFAIAISPSRLSSSTVPISLRYIRTGSSVRSKTSEDDVATATSLD